MEEFVLGFIAGEGSFYVTLLDRKSGHPRYRPKFKLGVNEEDIVKRICDQVGVGRVYKGSDTYNWNVQSVEENIRLSNWVEKNATKEFKMTNKYNQYKDWKKAVKIKESNKNKRLTVSEQKKMIDISYNIPDSDTKKISKEEWYKKAEQNKLHRCGEINSSGNECMSIVSNKNETCTYH